MNGSDQPPEVLSPAERRLEEHLRLLHVDLPAPPASMAEKIVRAARWQRAARRPLLAIGALAATLGDGIRLLLGSPPNRS